MQIDPELLSGLSDEELDALADGVLSPSAQRQLDELLSRNAEQPLSDAEQQELDQLVAKVDQLTILKTRARYTLAQRAGAATA
jgi:hypothetical protein